VITAAVFLRLLVTLERTTTTKIDLIMTMWPKRSLKRTAAPLLRSTLGSNSGVPCALQRSCRRLSLSSVVGLISIEEVSRNT